MDMTLRAARRDFLSAAAARRSSLGASRPVRANCISALSRIRPLRKLSAIFEPHCRLESVHKSLAARNKDEQKRSLERYHLPNLAAVPLPTLLLLITQTCNSLVCDHSLSCFADLSFSLCSQQCPLQTDIVLPDGLTWP